MFRKEFNSVAEYVAFCEEHGTQAKDVRRSGDSFTGGTWDDAVKLARSGWGEGAARALKLTTKLGNTASSMVLQHDPFMANEGIELDIGAYTSGVPECWIDTVPTYRPAEGNVVRLVATVSVACDVTTAEMIRKGCAIAAAVSALETAGRSVEVLSALAIRGRGRPSDEATALALVKVKSAGQPLDLSNLAYAVAHPTMLRRLGFAFLDYCAEVKGLKSVSRGNAYGYPVDVPVEDRGDVYAPANKCSMGEDAIMEWISGILTDQGIEVKAA